MKKGSLFILRFISIFLLIIVSIILFVILIPIAFIWNILESVTDNTLAPVQMIKVVSSSVFEADEIIVYLANHKGYTVAAIDKDVINAVKTDCFNFCGHMFS